MEKAGLTQGFGTHRVHDILEQVDTITGFFNNHFYGYGPTNALQMLELMDKITNHQKDKLEWLLGQLAITQTSLDEF